MSLNYLEISPKSCQFPIFQKPKAIGFYSIDKNRKYCSHARNLKYLYHLNQTKKLDLNVGYNQYQTKADTLENEEKIETLLLWITNHGYTKSLSTQNENHIFLCYRGLLANVMRTVYEQQEGWLICATKVNSLIFLCAFNTEEKKLALQRGKTPKEKLFEYWGRKFEQYLLTENPVKEPDITIPVNASEEFVVMFRTKLNKNYIFYGAEIDGINSPQYIDINSNVDSLNACTFIELKTSRHIQNAQQNRNFQKFKLIKWWSQSFLVGIEKIICGFRDDYGIVHNVESFNTRDLPKLANGMWNACVCANFLDDFLSFVKNILINEPNFAKWKFEWTPGSKQVYAEKITDLSKYNILPDWFITKCNTTKID